MLKSLLPFPAPVTGRMACSAALWSALLLTMVILFLATPTLNFDDLNFAEHLPGLLARHELGSYFFMELRNAEVGGSQIRTYGLARAIEGVLTAFSGKAPIPTYLFMIAVQAGGSLIIYRLLREISGDALTALFSAIAWFAAPSVLPLLKVEHHFLYLVAPFYPLLLWLLLVLQRGRLSHLLSISLLTLTSALGEAAVIPMGAARRQYAF